MLLLLGKSEAVALPYTPVLPTCIVEFRSTSFVATKSLDAVFARADDRGAGAEVVAVVKTAASDRKVVLAVAEMACPEPFHRLPFRRR